MRKLLFRFSPILRSFVSNAVFQLWMLWKPIRKNGFYRIAWKTIFVIINSRKRSWLIWRCLQDFYSLSSKSPWCLSEHFEKFRFATNTAQSNANCTEDSIVHDENSMSISMIRANCVFFAHVIWDFCLQTRLIFWQECVYSKSKPHVFQPVISIWICALTIS